MFSITNIKMITFATLSRLTLWLFEANSSHVLETLSQGEHLFQIIIIIIVTIITIITIITITITITTITITITITIIIITITITTITTITKKIMIIEV